MTVPGIPDEAMGPFIEHAAKIDRTLNSIHDLCEQAHTNGDVSKAGEAAELTTTLRQLLDKAPGQILAEAKENRA